MGDHIELKCDSFLLLLMRCFLISSVFCKLFSLRNHFNIPDSCYELTGFPVLSRSRVMMSSIKLKFSGEKEMGTFLLCHFSWLTCKMHIVIYLKLGYFPFWLFEAIILLNCTTGWISELLWSPLAVIHIINVLQFLQNTSKFTAFCV